MPVRSMKLKLLLDRSTQGQPLRQSLWLTHAVVNQAIAEIERVLLLCRGRSYYTGDDELIPEETVRQQALALARQVQAANGKPDAGTDEEVLAGLRHFYEALVPSVLLDDKGKPLKGGAQTSRGLAGPMMSATSDGMQKIFSKILDPLPAWVGKMKAETPGWEKDSKDWLEMPESQELQRATGSPPGWVRKLRAEQPWQEAFLKDQEKKRKDVEGVPTLVRRLKGELGLLPLMRPPIASRFVEGSNHTLKPWDYAVLRRAVEHLLSWESWNHRANGEHNQVLERVKQQRARGAGMEDLLNELRGYEAERHEELKRVALASDDRPFRLGTRTIRGWDRVREAWLGKKGADQASRLEVLAELQSKLVGKFGDPHLFRWLAEDGREGLWREKDPLPVLARLNALERLLERKKHYALHTLPDPAQHPKWMAFEASDAGNLRKYEVEIDEQGLNIRVKLLKCAEGRLDEEPFAIPLAPSGQMVAPKWDGKGKQRRLVFQSAHQTFRGRLGDSEILFARRHLENRKPEQLSQGDVGSVWLKLVLHVDAEAAEGWVNDRGQVVAPAAFHHFNTALVNASKHVDQLEPGLRVLSVDLGMRTFAACSVFELVKGKPANGLLLPADEEKDLWARHERSFLLSLPGETPGALAQEGRRKAYEELGALRRELYRLKDILRLVTRETSDERSAALVELRGSVGEELAQTGFCCLDMADLKPLEEAVVMDSPDWEAKIRAVHQTVEKKIGLRLGQWRRTTRRRVANESDRLERRGYEGGKSAWAIDYLDNVRRFLQRWSLHGRQYGQINRGDREKRGTFAAGLLDHINGLKEDRVKAGSDLIVQAARGQVPIGRRGWLQKYEPCRVILFEDLARYRFRTDRPRRENSQLMRWSHRQIVTETEMQAQIYGITVGTTGAGFSSRLHARSGAPGCRTRVLTAEDLQSPWMVKRLEQLAEELSVDVSRLQAGTRVPWDGGEDFTSLAEGGEAVTLHADLNAAQNLQRRFWTRHGDAYRISAVEVKQGEKSLWYPDREGVRLRGGLATVVGEEGYARLVPTADGDGLELEPVTKRNWRQATGGKAEAGDEEGLDEIEAVIAEMGGAAELERGDGRQVFFRDPSGRILRSDRWYEAKVFWGRVRRRVAAALGLGGSGS